MDLVVVGLVGAGLAVALEVVAASGVAAATAVLGAVVGMEEGLELAV